MRSTNLSKPFNILVMLSGTAFAITACAFAVMTVREMDPSAATGAEPDGLMAWMSQHGFSAMLWQLGLLGVFSVAAIATDEFWQKRRRAKDAAQSNG